MSYIILSEINIPYMTSYWQSIVTFALSCPVSESRHLGKFKWRYLMTDHLLHSMFGSRVGFAGRWIGVGPPFRRAAIPNNADKIRVTVMVSVRFNVMRPPVRNRRIEWRYFQMDQFPDGASVV